MNSVARNYATSALVVSAARDANITVPVASKYFQVSHTISAVAPNFRITEMYATAPFVSAGHDCAAGCSVSFDVIHRSSTIPMYVTLTDTSYFVPITSAVDYTRLWSMTNTSTSAVEFFSSTSAVTNHCISAGSILGDTYTISLSAVLS